jgi:hypothetical protein
MKPEEASGEAFPGLLIDNDSQIHLQHAASCPDGSELIRRACLDVSPKRA